LFTSLKDSAVFRIPRLARNPRSNRLWHV